MNKFQEYLTKKKYKFQKTTFNKITEKFNEYIRIINKHLVKIMLLWALIFAPIIFIINVLFIEAFSIDISSPNEIIYSSIISTINLLVSVFISLIIFIAFELIVLLFVIFILLIALVRVFIIFKFVKEFEFEHTGEEILIKTKNSSKKYKLVSSFEVRDCTYFFIQEDKFINYIFIPNRFLK